MLNSVVPAHAVSPGESFDSFRQMRFTPLAGSAQVNAILGAADPSISKSSEAESTGGCELLEGAGRCPPENGRDNFLYQETIEAGLGALLFLGSLLLPLKRKRPVCPDGSLF
jgi:hypothetical protein